MELNTKHKTYVEEDADLVTEMECCDKCRQRILPNENCSWYCSKCGEAYPCNFVEKEEQKNK